MTLVRDLQTVVVTVLSKNCIYFNYAYYTNYINCIAGSCRSWNPDHVWQESAQSFPRLSMDWVRRSSNLNCERLGWRTSARPILPGRLRQLTSWEKARCRLMNESLMLMVCMLTDPLWWMCRLAIFCNEYAPKCKFRFMK